MYNVNKYIRTKPVVFDLKLHVFVILLFGGIMGGLFLMLAFSFMMLIVVLGGLIGLYYLLTIWQDADFDEIIKVLPNVIINRFIS